MLARPPTSLASHLSPNTLLGVDDPRGVPRLPAGRGDAQHPPGLATGESPLPFRARRSCRPVGFEPPLAATCRYLGPTLSCPPPPPPRSTHLPRRPPPPPGPCPAPPGIPPPRRPLPGAVVLADLLFPSQTPRVCPGKQFGRWIKSTRASPSLEAGFPS